MLKSADVAPYVRQSVPWLADVADYYVVSLDDASAYPFMGHAVGLLIEKSSSSTEQDRDDIKAFFACVEVLLREGDSNVEDLVYIEVAEVLREVGALRGCFGPLLSAMVQTMEPQQSPTL